MAWLCVSLVAVANTFSISADLSSMAAVLTPVLPVSSLLGVAVIGVVVAGCEILIPYHRDARILRWLCLSLGAYIGVLFVANVDWGQVARSVFEPTLGDASVQLAAIIALAGTTISPYLFFWQASALYATIGINPFRALFLAAVLNGLAAPVLLAIIWWLARDSKLLGRWRSPWCSQALILACAIAMTLLPVAWLLA